MTTQIVKIERETKEQFGNLQQAMLDRLTAGLSSADADVKTQIGSAKAYLVDSFDEQVNKLREELKDTK